MKRTFRQPGPGAAIRASTAGAAEAATADGVAEPGNRVFDVTVVRMSR